MKSAWHFFWDITAVVFGLFIFWKIFNLSGKSIPGFGFFPIGVILGIFGLGIGAFFIHGIEILIEAIFGKIFNINFEREK